MVDFITQKLVRDTPEEYVRQNIEKALVRQYHYAPADCRPAFGIKVGSGRKKQADLVVFKQGAPHEQRHVRVIIETKKPKEDPDAGGLDQLKSYMASCPNALFAMWTNGVERFCFRRREEGGEVDWVEVRDLPHAGDGFELRSRPGRRQLSPATEENLRYAFVRCREYIAGSEGLNPPEAFTELIKLVFCKIEDERQRGEVRFYVAAGETAGETAAKPAKKRLQDLFDDLVIPKHPGMFTGDRAVINMQARTVAYVVGQMQDLSLLKTDVDVKGTAYESIVADNLSGDEGEILHPPQRLPRRREDARAAVGRNAAGPQLRDRRVPHHRHEPRPGRTGAGGAGLLGRPRRPRPVRARGTLPQAGGIQEAARPRDRQGRQVGADGEDEHGLE